MVFTPFGFNKAVDLSEFYDVLIYIVKIYFSLFAGTSTLDVGPFGNIVNAIKSLYVT